MGKARLELLIAQLVIAGCALRAAAAAAHEGQVPPVKKMPQLNLGADGFDYAGQLMPGNVRNPDVRIVSHPAVPVAAAHAGGHDPDDNAIGRGDRVRHLLDGDRAPECFVVDGTHGAIIPQKRRRSLGVE